MRYFTRYLISLILFIIVTANYLPITRIPLFILLMAFNFTIDLILDYRKYKRDMTIYLRNKYRIVKANEYGMGYCNCYVR